MSAQQTEPGAGYRADCLQSVDILADWPSEPWSALVAAFGAEAGPLLLLGEGSSRLFPAAFARFLARRWGRAGMIDDCGGREAAEAAIGEQHLLFVSNSGKTRELVELARATAAHPRRLSLLGSDDGDLAELIPERRCVLLRPEQAVAATASVIGQALVVAEALAAALGRRAPVAELREALDAVLNADLPPAVDALLDADVSRVWWGDGGSGEGAELALKTMETARIAGIHAPGTLLLHGIEEVLEPDDLVIWFRPPAVDRPLLQKALVDVAQARVLTAGSGDELWSLPDCGEWSPIVHLAAGWRLLGALAQRKGIDPDKPRRARKVGNPTDAG